MTRKTVDKPRAVSKADAAAAIEKTLGRIRELTHNAAVHKAATDAAVAEIERRYAETVEPVAKEIAELERRLKTEWGDFTPYAEGKSAEFTHGLVGTKTPPAKLEFDKGLKEPDVIDRISQASCDEGSVLAGQFDLLVTARFSLNREVLERRTAEEIKAAGMHWTEPKDRFFYEVKAVEEAIA